jgi:ATP-binding cassette subfamily C (CFTR/MRP) protein 1
VGARFRQATASALNDNTQAFVTTRLVFLWANSRIGVLNALLTFASAIFIVIQKDTLDIGLAGAALSFILSIGGFLGFMIVMFTQLDSSMNSVERIRHYTYSIPQEPEWVNTKATLPVGWPTQGRVEFEDAEMSYRPGLEPALKGVSASVIPCEKVGIAGRTGSGKSTFMLALFRMYELSRGKVLVDGVNIAEIGVHQLRKALAIIPQGNNTHITPLPLMSCLIVWW